MRVPLVFLSLALVAPAALYADISLSITIGPPPMPVYEQPAVPDGGYSWQPGYWAWGEDGYFWIPGTWVLAPEVGLLWTPGYWGWDGGYCVFHQGYWGPTVGFYGGINYGYGYGGSGFEGGHWQGRNYYYNRAVTNIGGNTTNVYNKTVVVNNTHVSYNGGQGGVNAAPNEQEHRAAQERHVQPTREQDQHAQVASRNRDLLASVNRGRPPVAATAKPGDFSPRAVVPAKAAGGQVDENALKATPKTMPPANHPAPGNAARPTQPAGPAAAPAPREPAPGQRPQVQPSPAPGGPAAPVHPAEPAKAPQAPREQPRQPAPGQHPEAQPSQGRTEPPASHPAPQAGAGQHPAAAPEPGHAEAPPHQAGKPEHEPKP